MMKKFTKGFLWFVVSMAFAGRIFAADGDILQVTLTEEESTITGRMVQDVAEGVTVEFLKPDGTAVEEGTVTKSGSTYYYAAPVNTYVVPEGATEISWDTAENWTLGRVPTANERARIYTGHTEASLKLSKRTLTLASLEIAGYSDSSLTLIKGGTYAYLTLSEKFYVNTGNVDLPAYDTIETSSILVGANDTLTLMCAKRMSGETELTTDVTANITSAGPATLRLAGEGRLSLTGSLSGELCVHVTGESYRSIAAVNTYTGGTKIDEGAVLWIRDPEALGSGKITGAGELRIACVYSNIEVKPPLANTAGLSEETWCGTVRICTTGDRTSLGEFGLYGNPKSKVVFDGAQGHFIEGGDYGEVIVENQGLTLNYGNKDKYATCHFAKLSGDGKLASGSMYSAIDYRYELIFDDVSAFRGNLDFGSDGGYFATFFGGTPEGYATEKDIDTYRRHLYIAAGCKATLAEGKTWTMSEGESLMVAGTLAGAGTLRNGNLEFFPGSKLDVTEGAISIPNNTIAFTDNAMVHLVCPETVPGDGSFYILKCIASQATAENAKHFVPPAGFLVRPVTTGTTGFVLTQLRAANAASYSAETNATLSTLAAEQGLADGFAVKVKQGPAEPTEDVVKVDNTVQVFKALPSTADTEANALTLSYNFGIERLLVRREGDALYAFLCVKVEGADYAEGTVVKVYLDGEPLPDDVYTVTEAPDGATPTGAGIRWLKMPFSGLANDTAEGNKTSRITVRAVKEETQAAP